jgi:hypothetical protein
MRGNEKAKHLIRNTHGSSISVVTFIELVQRLRNKEALNILRKSISSSKNLAHNQKNKRGQVNYM